MKRWLRKLRGILSIGAIWGTVGGAIGAVGGVLVSVFGGFPLFSSLVEWCLGAGGLGFLFGSGFAVVLTVLEGRRTLDELTPGRAALWGALAGAAVPFGSLLFYLGSGGTVPFRVALIAVSAASGIYGAVSAGLAAGTVALARRAPDELNAGLVDGNASLPSETISVPKSSQPT